MPDILLDSASASVLHGTSYSKCLTHTRGQQIYSKSIILPRAIKNITSISKEKNDIFYFICIYNLKYYISPIYFSFTVNPTNNIENTRNLLGFHGSIIKRKCHKPCTLAPGSACSKGKPPCERQSDSKLSGGIPWKNKIMVLTSYKYLMKNVSLLLQQNANVKGEKE